MLYMWQIRQKYFIFAMQTFYIMLKMFIKSIKMHDVPYYYIIYIKNIYNMITIFIFLLKLTSIIIDRYLLLMKLQIIKEMIIFYILYE